MKTNPKRAPYSDKVKAKVREMREEGYSNVQITEATGVPASTIARWAAEGGWRVADLVNAQVSFSPEAKPPCACVVRCMAPRTEGCRMNPPVEMGQVPDGLLPGLEGEGWGGDDRSFLRPQESEPSARDRDPHLRGDERDETGLSDDARGISGLSPASPGTRPGFRDETGSRLRAGNGDSQATAKAQGVEPTAKNKPEQSRQQQLEDALEKAAIAAEDAILRSNFTAAAKATQMADTLSRALERLRNSAPEEQPEGVFYTREDIEAARADLPRRFDRLARTLRVDEMIDP